VRRDSGFTEWFEDASLACSEASLVHMRYEST
jgi:hypothetical protein